MLSTEAPWWAWALWLALAGVTPGVFGWLGRRQAKKHAAPVETVELNRQKVDEIEKRTAAQLAITREAAAPPVGRNHVAHVECQLAGHMWGQTPLGYMRCTRCGGHGLRVGTITADAIHFGGGPVQTVNPAVDHHEAFPEDAAWERKIKDLDNRIYRATGIRMGYIEPGSIEEGHIR